MSITRIPRRNVIFALLLLGLCAASTTYATWPRKATMKHLYAEQVPMNLGQWSARKYELDTRTIQVLGTDDIVARIYTRLNEPAVDFVVIFAKHTRRATHPPEICLKGEGWITENLTKRQISPAILPERLRGKGFAIRELVVGKPGTRNLVYYFYKSGRKYTHSYVREQIHVALGRLADPDTSDALIRLITRIDSDGIEPARSRLDEFPSVVLPEVDRHLP